MISVLFWPIHPPPSLRFPSKISRRAQWVILTLYKLESPGYQELFFSASREILVCSKIWETRLYTLSALVFSHLAWKDRPFLSYSSLKKKKKTASPFAVNSDAQLPWSTVFSEKDHILILGASVLNSLTASHPLSTSFLSSSLYSLVSEITTDQLLSLGVFSSYSSSYL